MEAGEGKEECKRENYFEIQRIMPTAQISQQDIKIIRTKEFEEALKIDLAKIKSPSLCDTELFKRITIPYKYMYARCFGDAIEAWEDLLEQIQNIDKDKFKIMHKGTPYYFCAMSAFSMRDYERANFYFDAALAEDLKNYESFGLNIEVAPAFLFLTLDDSNPNQAAHAMTMYVLDRIGERLNDYKVCGGEEFLFDDFRRKFLLKPLKGGFSSGFSSGFEKKFKYSTLITTFFSFILETIVRNKELSLRSSNGGTMEPFFLHLFKGCLLFESLVKASDRAIGKESDTLGKLLKDHAIKDFLGLTIDGAGNFTFDDVVKCHKEWWDDRKIPFNDRVVWTAYRVRNATGHNLMWTSSAIDEPLVYFRMALDISFACVLAIQKLY